MEEVKRDNVSMQHHWIKWRFSEFGQCSCVLCSFLAHLMINCLTDGIRDPSRQGYPANTPRMIPPSPQILQPRGPPRGISSTTSLYGRSNAFVRDQLLSKPIHTVLSHAKPDDATYTPISHILIERSGCEVAFATHPYRKERAQDAMVELSECLPIHRQAKAVNHPCLPRPGPKLSRFRFAWSMHLRLARLSSGNDFRGMFLYSHQVQFHPLNTIRDLCQVLASKSRPHPEIPPYRNVCFVRCLSFLAINRSSRVMDINHTPCCSAPRDRDVRHLRRLMLKGWQSCS